MASKEFEGRCADSYGRCVEMIDFKVVNEESQKLSTISCILKKAPTGERHLCLSRFRPSDPLTVQGFQARYDMARESLKDVFTIPEVRFDSSKRVDSPATSVRTGATQ